MAGTRSSHTLTTLTALLGAGLAVLATWPAPCRAWDCDHCPPPYIHCQKRPPRIKFKCVCPNPVCVPCDEEFWGYYPTCWRHWPAPYANCPGRYPPWVTVPPQCGAMGPNVVAALPPGAYPPGAYPQGGYQQGTYPQGVYPSNTGMPQMPPNGAPASDSTTREEGGGSVQNGLPNQEEYPLPTPRSTLGEPPLAPGTGMVAPQQGMVAPIPVGRPRLMMQPGQPIQTQPTQTIPPATTNPYNMRPVQQ